MEERIQACSWTIQWLFYASSICFVIFPTIFKF